MITYYFMITEKSNRLQVIMITDYDYPMPDRPVRPDFLLVDLRILLQ